MLWRICFSIKINLLLFGSYIEPNNKGLVERAIIAEHLGFCENCWSTCYIAEENGKKVKRKFKGKAFIDLAGEHGVVPSSADRIYRGAINKLRKALEEDKWL